MKPVLGVATAALLFTAACGSSEPEVISLSASSVRNETASDATGGTSSKLMIAPAVEYSLADGLAKPAVKARAWRTTVPDDATSRLASLAEAFAVTGKPVTSPDGSVTIGGDKKVSSWSWGGVVSWAYDPGVSAVGRGGGAASAPCDPSAGSCDDAVATPDTVAPPTDLISTADALVKSRRILGAAGYGVDQTSLAAGTSDWSTWVDVEILVGGVPSGLTGRIDFGSAGVVTSAYGQFVSLERADEYPLVDLETAVERLAFPMFATTVARGATSSVVVPGETVPGSTESIEPVAVEITSVELALQQVWVSETESVLVPSYRFSSVDGTVGIVFAVEDKYLDINSDDGAEPVPGTAVPEPAPAPDEMAPIPQSDADVLIGLSEDEATKVATGRGWTVRIAERDGEQFMLTLDFQTNRVNLTITKGRVTAVTVG